MAEIDDELVARAIRWCAEAGRHTGADEVRGALGSLSWDQLLAARALLADPPPPGPLGPAALADIARGASPDVAAEREREGRYRAEEAAELPVPSPALRPSRAWRKRPAALQQPVIRRARDRVPAAPPTARALPLLDELHLPEGRGALEALVRKVGPVTPLLVGALAAGWRRADGLPPDEPALRELLVRHGLDRALARREREALLHALRAARGLKRRAAASLGIPVPALEVLLAGSGAGPQADELRERRRTELRRRATLSERAHLVLEAREELEDLEILGEIEKDLARRLPDHLRALAAGGGPMPAALARSLSLPRADAVGLLARLNVALPAAADKGRAPTRPATRPPPRRPSPTPPPRTSRAPAGAEPRSRRPGAPSRRPPAARRPTAGPRRPRPV